MLLLRNREDDLPVCLTALHLSLCICRLLQRVHRMDPRREGAPTDQVEDVAKLEIETTAVIPEGK